MRGTLSVITAALITLLALTSFITYLSLELRKLPQQYSRLNYELLSNVGRSSKDVRVFLSNDGLYVKTLNPPITVESVLAITPSGIKQLINNSLINTSTAKLLDYSIVSNVLSGGYIVVIADGRKYFIVDRGMLSNSSTSNALNDELLNDLSLRLNYLRPTIHVGILLKDSFIDNPVPGLPSDPEANYLPVGYALVSSDSQTISKGDWYLYIDPRSNPNKLGITYGSGSTNISYLGMGFYRISSSHSTYVKWYELVSGYSSGWYITYETIASGTALLYLYPMIISGNKSFNVVFYIENLGSYVGLTVKPVLYVVMLNEFINGLPILSSNLNPVLESVIRYSGIRPLYVWEGSKVSTYLGSGGDISVAVDIDSASILSALNADKALALVGIRLSARTQLSIKLASFITDYDIAFTIGADEVGKYVFIPTASNLVPEVTSPSGGRISIYRSPNVVSSLAKYLVWFTPDEAGNYTVTYRLGSYASIPELRLPVNLTWTSYGPVLEYIRNQHLSYSNYVVQDSIALERDRAVLVDYEYFEAGSETWYSGDLMVVSGLPTSGQLNFTYYVNTVVQGIRTLNLNQNASFDLYYCWSSWSCYYYWRVYVTFYPNGSTTKLYVRGDVLWHSGSYYLSFGVRIPLSNTQVTAYPTINGIKHIYRAGDTAYAIYVASTLTELVRQNNTVLDLRS